MSFEAMLATRAFELGRAQRTALYRHRAIAGTPFGIVAFELGAEPYTVGSIALGRQGRTPTIFVPGQPIDRRLLFHAITGFAREFCDTFEGYAAGNVETVQHWGEDLEIPVSLPQIIVPNEQTIKLLYRLGRRLAYLKTDGPTPADPSLPRLGLHLMWLTRYARTQGQQLLVPLSQFLRQHYATAMSSYEAGSLAALEAWIDPPAGSTGPEAAAATELQAVGPTLSPSDAAEVSRLMEHFDERRQRSIDPKVYTPLLGPLRTFYAAKTQHTWTLLWKAVARERKVALAASVGRREREDRIEYARHMQWMNGPAQGRLRARTHLRSNVISKRRLEAAQALVEAEEAIDDPLRMVPQIVAGLALAGEVVNLAAGRRELVGQRNCLRPSITVRTDENCSMPIGTALWWTDAAASREWLLSSVVPVGSGSDVTLILQTNRQLSAGFPAFGSRVRFTQKPIPDSYEPILPSTVPWTHKAPETPVDDLDPPNAAESEAA